LPTESALSLKASSSPVHSTTNNRLIGNIGFRREPQIKSRHKGTIWGVYLTPAYRGKGIAKNLLTATLDRIKT